MADKSGIPMRGPLAAGVMAPDFSLSAAPDHVLALRSLRGRPVILVFYPADWSPVCGDQLTRYNEMLPVFQLFGAEIVGVSVDSVWSHAAYRRQRKIAFQLLADFEPKGEVARRYGVYRDSDGTCDRALFVIDPHGIIRWSHVSAIELNPGADGILRALESLAPRGG